MMAGLKQQHLTSDYEYLMCNLQKIIFQIYLTTKYTFCSSTDGFRSSLSLH